MKKLLIPIFLIAFTLAVFANNETINEGIKEYSSNNSVEVNNISISAIDTTPPTILSITPTGDLVRVQSNWQFNCTASDDVAIDTMTLYNNFYGDYQWTNKLLWTPNNPQLAIFNENGIPKGNFLWACRVCDNSSNCVFSENKTLTNDYPSPFVINIEIISSTDDAFEDVTCSSEVLVYTDSNFTVDLYVNNSLVKSENFTGQVNTYNSTLSSSNFGYDAEVFCEINGQSRFGTSNYNASLNILGMQCNDVDFDSLSVCSSKGTCVSEDNCSCDTGYYGSDCQIEDIDGDGYNSSVDCNDNNSSINPGALELPCDNVDNDCDTDTDETRVDFDNDGVDECSDCNDNNSNNYPGNIEICDYSDNNCNSQIDENVTTTYYLDLDGDSYGINSTVQDCSVPTNYTTTLGDCDDNNFSINPSMTETCNYADDDCNSQIDENVTTTYYLDLDGDSYGINSTVQDCSVPTNYTTTLGDCDDNNFSINPSMTETCNYVDDDCNSQIDENVTTTYYLDLDGDGFGINSIINECTLLTNYATTLGDCNDNSSDIHPGGTDICGNGIDEDCSGSDLSCPKSGGGGNSCDPRWECGEWGTCSLLGIKTRTCTDIRNCNTETKKPSEEAQCFNFIVLDENETIEEIINETINETIYEIINETLELNETKNESKEIKEDVTNKKVSSENFKNTVLTNSSKMVSKFFEDIKNIEINFEKVLLSSTMAVSILIIFGAVFFIIKMI